MSRRAAAGCLAGVLTVVLIASCGGGTPNSPEPIPQPPPIDTTPPPAPPNAAPVIESISAQGRRSKEPANFADLGETIDLTAKVRDDETAVEELQYAWTAEVGTIEGAGVRVTWRAPDTASTPLSVSISLKVTEKYGYPAGPKIYQQDASRGTVVSLHNSGKELGDMARQFLLDFSDSNIRDISSIMRNFIPGCYGTSAETDQVTDNRRRYRIVESRIGEPQTKINFGGVCPYDAKPGDACTAVPVFWKSIDFDSNNELGSVTGTDWVASFYLPDKQRWGLCDSSFEGRTAANMRDFVR